uniref:NADH dehydrogenase subunit 4L n=1 Tax=Brugia timori TaxID=42155 RepID=A0A0R3R9N0_9BILA
MNYWSFPIFFTLVIHLSSNEFMFMFLLNFFYSFSLFTFLLFSAVLSDKYVVAALFFDIGFLSPALQLFCIKVFVYIFY